MRRRRGVHSLSGYFESTTWPFKTNENSHVCIVVRGGEGDGTDVGSSQNVLNCGNKLGGGIVVYMVLPYHSKADRDASRKLKGGYQSRTGLVLTQFYAAEVSEADGRRTRRVLGNDARVIEEQGFEKRTSEKRIQNGPDCEFPVPHIAHAFQNHVYEVVSIEPCDGELVPEND